MVNLRS